MREKVIKNVEASIRAKLLNYAKATDENYNAVLNRFFQERFLARLSETKYKQHFVLKGGLLLLIEHVSQFRPTIDIDLLGVNIDNSSKTIQRVIIEICEIAQGDGIFFNSNDLSMQILKEDAEYEGLRFRLPVYLGETNSRMKDFYDIIFLASNNSFSSCKLSMAIEATFHKRETDIARRLFIYQDQYIELKSGLWRIFMRKIQSKEKSEFSAIISKLKAFIEPVLADNELKADWNVANWEWLNS